MKLKPKSTTKNPKALVYKRFVEIDMSFNNNTIYLTADGKYWLFNQETLTFIETSESENAINVTGTTILKYENIFFRYSTIVGWIRQNEKFIPKSTEATFNSISNPNVSYTFSQSLANHKINFYYLNVLHQSLTITGYIVENGKKYVFSGTAQSGKNTTLEATYQEDVATTTNSITFSTDQFSIIGIKFTVTLFEKETETLSAKFGNIGKYQTNKYYYYASFDFMIKGSIEGTTAQYIKGNIIPLTALNIKYFDDNINLSPDDLVVIENKLYSVENPETVLKQQPKPFKIYFATLNNIL